MTEAGGRCKKEELEEEVEEKFDVKEKEEEEVEEEVNISNYFPRMEMGGGRDFETLPRAPPEGIFVIERPPLLLSKDYICGFIHKGKIRSNSGPTKEGGRHKRGI
jgi:hypothetical protein